MKNLTKILFGVNLMLAVFLLIEIHALKKENPLKLRTSSSAGIVDKAQIPGTDGRSDVYCAILLIPKTLLPVVKQMSRHKIAKGIKMLPADMEWNQGNLVASSKETFAVKNRSRIDKSARVAGKPQKGFTKTQAEFRKRMRAVTLLTFLAHETKTRFWQKLNTTREK
jgi:hypothetical protein